ncbi:MAG: DUF4166 domain-containing protein [Gammaproteobacteria bacterium]|nr:DUF4166 domain-containing protein [Gammaproteobacteria bacterium]
MNTTLYQKALGEEFKQLSPLLRQFHSELETNWVGESQIDWSSRKLIRLLLHLGGLPREASKEKLTMRIKVRNKTELWMRHFGKKMMKSKQRYKGNTIRESFGPFTLFLVTHVKESSLYQRCFRSKIFVIPLPSFFRFNIDAYEWQENDRFNFQVNIGFASVRLIHYRGWLAPAEESV